MNGEKQCGGCGRPVQRNVKYCPNCGYENKISLNEDIVSEEAAPMRRCKHCGSVLNELAKFCGSCGQLVEE